MSPQYSQAKIIDHCSVSISEKSMESTSIGDKPEEERQHSPPIHKIKRICWTEAKRRRINSATQTTSKHFNNSKEYADSSSSNTC